MGMATFAFGIFFIFGITFLLAFVRIFKFFLKIKKLTINNKDYKNMSLEERQKMFIEMTGKKRPKETKKRLELSEIPEHMEDMQKKRTEKAETKKYDYTDMYD